MLNNFKKLPTGVRRLLIVWTLIVPIIVTMLFADSFNFYGGDYLIFPLFFSIIYWFFVLLWIWVYDGFKSK